MKTDDKKGKFSPGQSPEEDAWYTSFFIENHLDYYAYPDHVASPEQIRFMVQLEESEWYYPCSDRIFEAIMNKNQSAFIQKQYHKVLQRIMYLIKDQIEDQKQRQYLESLIIIKFKHETRDELMIPSRLEKRLLKILFHRTQISDPFLMEKTDKNRRAAAVLKSDMFLRALNRFDTTEINSDNSTLKGIKEHVESLELKRLLSVMVERSLWEDEQAMRFAEEDFIRIMARKFIGNGVDELFKFLGILHNQPGTTESTKKILWLMDESGEIMFDLAAIRYLTRIGHKIIIGFKSGPLYSKAEIRSAAYDLTLAGELEDAFLIKERDLSKNDLLKVLRNDSRIFIISDGTQEQLNLLLTSTTFARIFKEVDGIISRGNDQKNVFFDTHFQFTQNIFNITAEGKDSVAVSYKPRHQDFIKFSHKDLEKKAKIIIDMMSDARGRGETVIFYSGIIGSIPGKIDIAKKIMSVFIEHLKEQTSQVFIINPSEYYEPGMDADDLMYMWEIVQRSGFIDTWRFQTYNDIVEAFRLMETRVPPEWVGKDATYSTGCTKEMAIALEVQEKYPEMQIIGPTKERFMRRKDYGVGKMYDQRLGGEGVCYAC
ncbi:MAG: hypothetical protein JRI91_10085 [Deltaproteobacteria bacterium]|nr:hypothetical protein [Deltaproteobacteria bacterium]